MIATIIGISTGLLVMLLIGIAKRLDKKLVYGLTLSAIGFIYVGFVWTDLQALIIVILQAILFLFLSYYGVKKHTNILAAGYFLHGCWDIAYSFFDTGGLVPPHYDLFCLSVDCTIAIYLLVSNHRYSLPKNIA